MIICIIIHLIVTKLAYTLLGNTYEALVVQWLLTVILCVGYLNLKYKNKKEDNLYANRRNVIESRRIETRS